MEPNQSGTDGTSHSAQSGGNWLFPVLLAIVLLILFGITRWLPKTEPQQSAGQQSNWTPTSQPTGETVSLTIDFGNGASKEFAALAWQQDMTVADLLMAAREYRPGIDFTQKGTGESGFLTSLDGLANEGGGGKNWIFLVDDQNAHVSFCQEKIEPGMHILWTFTDELYNADSE